MLLFTHFSVLFANNRMQFVNSPHHRSSSHTLNLIASHDTAAADSDLSHKRLSCSALAKCSALWNKASRSTAHADLVSEKWKVCLIVPNATRWNSFYNAVDKIQQVIDSNPEDVITAVFVALDVPTFRANDLAFIKEYCCVMQPLANALDILQAELKCFFGYILPSLTSLRCKLTAMKPNLKIAGPLVDAILHGLNTRFEGFETRADALLDLNCYSSTVSPSLA